MPNKNEKFSAISTIFTILSLAIASVTNEVKRPFITVMANGSPSEWLFDTGAAVTVMNINEFRKISLANRPQKINVIKDLRCASNNQLQIVGTYLMNLSISNHSIQQVVYVCKNLGQSAILGIDAIEKFQLNYSVTKKKFSFENEVNTTRKGILSAISAHTIPPFSVQPIRMYAIDEGTGTRWPTGVTAVAVVRSPLSPLLTGDPGLVTATQTGEVTVLLHNCAPTEIAVARGDILGEIESVQGQHFEQVKVQEIQAALQASQRSCPPPLSDERKRQMLGDLNLNVPINEKENYLRLIFNNYDVFSKDGNDLGRANHYEHEINIKHKNPIYIKQFRIPEAHRSMLETQVKLWMKQGIIQRSTSKYNSPVFIVPKKEPGQYRFVQDFRQLNQSCYDDKYCMKEVNECIADIGRSGSTIFSTLDLTSGFHQMPLGARSRQYTAFTLPGLGQFEWIVSASTRRFFPGNRFNPNGSRCSGDST
jgi:dUTPase